MCMATATYSPVCGGTIASAWNYSDGGFNYTFSIPKGTGARVELLTGSSLTVNGLSVTPEELGGKTAEGRYIFELTAGEYNVKVTD